MAEPLEILIVEDTPVDFMLVQLELRAHFPGVVTECVDDKAALVAALERKRWNLVISDYRIPGLPFEETLATIKDRKDPPPVILVSGNLGEQAAVDLLKLGVSDFVLKDSLVRLTPAVRRTLDEVAQLAARREAEAALQQAQKLEAVGQLAAGVAHDFNNMLSVISTCADLALRALDQGETPARDDLEEIRRASQRAAMLTRQLLALSRRQVMEPIPVDVGALVQNLEKLLRRILPENIELRVVRAGEAGPVLVDPGQLEQVVVNLVVNARDALPSGGTIEISVKEVDGPASAGAAPGRWVVLTVRDDGCGMSEEVQRRLFEPFFTTKERGKGTGLGLATVYGIVNQSGGRISVWSAPMKGARFEITLPRTDRPLAAPREERPASHTHGSELILLVEDQSAVRAAMRRILESAGYRVLAAASGEEALVLSDQAPAVPDLLLTDLLMPGMSGVELVQTLERRGKKPRCVLFASGHLDRSLDESELRRGAEFLQKPFNAGSLTRRVREVLDR